MPMQITPSLHAIRHSFRIPVAPGISLDRFVYSYFISGETVTLIDTGVAGSEERIFSEIRSSGRDPSEVALVLLTHSHPDHIGSAPGIRKATGCTIAAHPAEKTWIEDVERQNRERPVPGFTSLVEGPVKVDHELVDGDVVELSESGGCEILALHTPGHSAGSLSLFLQGEGVLFSGDAVPVAGDQPVYDDAPLSLQSVDRLLRLKGIRTLLPAWDEPATGREAYLRMESGAGYLRRIHAAVRECTARGISDPLEVTRMTAASLGLPPQAVNPLLVRTITANLLVRDQEFME